MAALTRSRSPAPTGVAPDSTLDTVPTETPARLATSLIVAIEVGPCSHTRSQTKIIHSENILTCLDDKCIIYFEPIHNRLACLGPEKGGKRDALPEKNKRIVVVGSANMDIVISVDRLPRGGETIPGGAMALFPGGKGANQACAAAKLAGGACLIAQVGNDRFGEALLASIEEAGVDTALIGASARASGCASIYVLPDGQNSIVIYAGANATLDPTTALSRLETLGSPGFVLSQLEIPVETVEAVLTWARAHGAVTILDPAPARPLPPSLLGTIDFLTPNQSEAATLDRKSPRLISSHLVL